MKNFLLLCTIFAGLSISRGGSSHCQFKHEGSRPLDIGFGAEPKINSYTITCSNLSSDLEIDNYGDKEFGIHDLVTLNIEDSTIPVLPRNSSLAKLTGLTTINLNNSGIEEISIGAFSGLSKLRKLKLSSNRLVKVERGAFDGLAELKVLDLSKNNIEEIEEGSFSSLKALNQLLLNQNNLRVIQQHLTKGLILDVLDVSDNPFQEFQEFGTNHVGQLTAKRFPLKTFPVNLANSEIYHLDLQEGQLETIDFSFFPDLSIFDVSSNKISLVQNWDKMQGYEFSLSNNRLTEAEISDRVEILNLSQNKIKQLRSTPSDGTRKLRVLDLSSNEISEIPADVFRNRNKLYNLNLQNNRISVLPENVFVNCTALKSINLSDNQLRSLTLASLNGVPRDAYIDLAGNPIDQTNLAEIKTLFKNLITE